MAAKQEAIEIREERATRSDKGKGKRPPPLSATPPDTLSKEIAEAASHNGDILRQGIADLENRVQISTDPQERQILIEAVARAKRALGE